MIREDTTSDEEKVVDKMQKSDFFLGNAPWFLYLCLAAEKLNIDVNRLCLRYKLNGDTRVRQATRVA